MLCKKGAEVIIIRCQRAFDFCTVMDYKGLSPDSSDLEKEEICFKCIQSSTRFGERNAAIRYEKIERLESTKRPIRDISMESIYEPVIKFKKIDLEISVEEYPFFMASTRAFNSAFESGMRLNNEIQPDIAIVYSPQYAVNSGFSKAAEVSGVPVVFMEGSTSPYNRYSAVRFWDWKRHGLSNPVATSEDYAHSRINFRALSHFRLIRKGVTHSSYSTVKRNLNIRKHYQIDAKRKIILAVLSSTDEIFSAYAIKRISKTRLSTSVFKDQIEWIESTISYMSKLHNAILIVRVHPREFSNQRDKITSEMFEIWENKSREINGNVIWNLPTDNISLYDLLDAADVVTTGWSSVALEALYQKIPVVTYDEDVSGFPKSLTRTGNSKAEYLSNLEQSLLEKPRWRFKISVLRYISFRDFDSTFRTGGAAYGSPIFSFFPSLLRVFLTTYNNVPNKLREFLDKSMNRCRDEEKIWLWMQKKASEVKK